MEYEKLCSLVSMAEGMPFNNNRHYLLQMLSSQCYHEAMIYRHMVKCNFKNRHKKPVSLSSIRSKILLVRAYEGLNNKALSLDY